MNFRAPCCIITDSNAGVMELVDVVDSKSTASDGVPVRVRPPAPRWSKLYVACSDFFQKVRVHSFRCSSFSSRKRSAGLRLDEMGALDWCIFFVNIVQQRSHDESRDFFVGFRSFYSLHPSEISMLGVGKAAPAQFVLRRKTNLRRISAAGQKAGGVGLLYLFEILKYRF